MLYTDNNIVISCSVEIRATLSVGKLSDANAIGRMQLLHKETTAGVNHFDQLQQARCCHQTLHRLITQVNET